MRTDIPSSEARRRFSLLIRRLETDGKSEYRIRSHDRVVARLRRPSSRPNAGEVLLRIADEIARLGVRRPKGPAVTSENYKEFLYGHWPPPATPGRK